MRQPTGLLNKSNKGEYGHAANDFHAALKIDPNLEPAKQYWALTAEKIGNDIAGLLNSAEIDDYCNRALEVAENGDYNEVIKILSEGLEHYPENERLLKARGFYYFKTGKFDKVIDDYDNFIEHNKNDDFVYALRGLIKFQRGKPFDAEVDFREALHINPNCEHVPLFMKGIINNAR